MNHSATMHSENFFSEFYFWIIMASVICLFQRSHGGEEKSGSEGSEDDDYVPYVPVKIRKQQMVSNVTKQRNDKSVQN